MTVAWRKDGDDFVLEPGLPGLRRRGVRVGPSGIESGLLRRKRWAWPAIAAVTWDGRPHQGALAVCLRGDPWVKELSAPVLLWNRSPDRLCALLEEIRPLVEAMGARVEGRDEAATHWWHLDPEARR